MNKKQKTNNKLSDNKLDNCPICGSPLISKWSGVKCSKCNYWFCY